MTTPTTWIPITTRRPTEAEQNAGIAVGCYRNGEWSQSPVFYGKTWGDDRTHWTPAQLPPPPPKERTQREEDEEAFYKHMNNEDRLRGCIEIWHAALRYRDAQNREDWLRLCANDPGPPLMRLRKRSGL
jgi:hypothetical protein